MAKTASGANWGKRPTATNAAVEAFVSGKDKKAEKENWPRLNVLISPELQRRVKIGCATENVSLTKVVTEFLEERFPQK